MSYLRALGWLVAGGAVLVGTAALDIRTGTFSSHTDGLIAMSAGLLAAVVALLSWFLGPVALPVCALVAAAAVTVASLGLDRAPLAFMATAGLLVTVLVVAWRGQRVLAVVVSPLLVAALVGQPLIVREDHVAFVVVALALALVSVVMTAAGLAARLVGISRQRQEEAVRLAQRAEFARDLHDYVAHHVTGILLLAQGARAVAAKEPQLVLPALERIEQAGTEATSTMRRMVGLLREPDAAAELAPPATVADIGELVDGFHTVNGPTARLELTGGPFEGVPVEVQSTVHRVVMESLTNVRKHADGACHVEVRVCRTGDRVTAAVTDDGRPAHHTGGGFGLRGLTDRATALDGRISAGPGPAGGWIVEASFPIGRSQ